MSDTKGPVMMCKCADCGSQLSMSPKFVPTISWTNAFPQGVVGISVEPCPLCTQQARLEAVGGLIETWKAAASGGITREEAYKRLDKTLMPHGQCECPMCRMQRKSF